MVILQIFFFYYTLCNVLYDILHLVVTKIDVITQGVMRPLP